MNALSILVGFAENNAWANHRLYVACASLHEAALDAPGTSFFPTIRRTLSHNLIVDWYYVDCLERGTLGRAAFGKEVPFDTFAPMRDAQRAVDARLVRFCTTLASEAALEETVTLPREKGAQVERVGKVLLHLFEHQIHHRGQAHAMLSGTSAKPPQLDEFFLDDERDLRAAELIELGLPVR